MPDPSPSLSAEIEALKAAYAAINRNDIPGFVAIFDPQIERFEPPGFPHGERFHGIEAFAAHVVKARGELGRGNLPAAAVYRRGATDRRDRSRTRPAETRDRLA